MAALQHDSKGAEMIHFMIKMQLLLVFYPQKLKKKKQSKQNVKSLHFRIRHEVSIKLGV